MRFLSEQTALDRLDGIISDLRSEITGRYETRAKSCLTCETQGACCLDAHFVNVHISRLEAAAVKKSLSKLPGEKQLEINTRIDAAIEKYGLKLDGDSYAQTYACPLFEKGTGCLVHATKPIPCIVHACYEKAEDLPPDELQTTAEREIEDLNVRAYGRSLPLLPLPLALRKA